MLNTRLLITLVIGAFASSPALLPAQSVSGWKTNTGVNDARRTPMPYRLQTRIAEPISTPMMPTGSPGGAAPTHHHHGNHANDSVTNNYYGYGFPSQTFYGGNVYNNVNGVPVHFGNYPVGIAYPYPYGYGYGYRYGYGYTANGLGGYGSAWYPPQFNAVGPLNQVNFFAAGGGRGQVNVPQVNVPRFNVPQANVVPPGLANDASGEIQRRVDVLRRSTPEGRDRADRLLAQGDALFALQRFSAASAKYRDAMAKAPDYPKPHFRLAHCSIATASFDLALTHSLMALELAGSAERVNFSLDELYRGNELTKQSHFERLQDAILREPNDGGLVFLLALTLHYDDRPWEARQQFIASQAMPGAHQAYVHLFLPIVPVAEPIP